MQMTDATRLYCAEVSKSQRLFHWQPLFDAVKSNILNLNKGQIQDWIIFFVGSPEKCLEAIEIMRGRLGW